MKKAIILIMLVVATSLSVFSQSVRELNSQRMGEIRSVEKQYKGITFAEMRAERIDSINARYDRLVKQQMELETQGKQPEQKSFGAKLEHKGPGGDIESTHISSVQASKAYERIANADANYTTANANAYFTMKIADAIVTENATFSANPINVGFEGTIANNNKYYSMEIVIYSTDGSNFKKSLFIAPWAQETVYLLPGVYRAEIKVNGVQKNPVDFSVRPDRMHTYNSKPVYWYVYDGRNVRY